MRSVHATDRLRGVAASLVMLAAGLALLLVLSAGHGPGSGRGLDPRPDAAPARGSQSSAAGQASSIVPPQAIEAAAAGAVVPTELRIPGIAVEAAVESRGTTRYENPFTGQMVDGFDVPESMHTTSWWSDGPLPGSGQMAVILGHQQGEGGAVFDRIHELRAGDEVLLSDSGGAVLRLRVLGAPLTGLDKSTSALSDALNGHPHGAAVALVTCGGEFDDDAGTSEDNTVVFAALAG